MNVAFAIEEVNPESPIAPEEEFAGEVTYQVLKERGGFGLLYLAKTETGKYAIKAFDDGRGGISESQFGDFAKRAEDEFGYMQDLSDCEHVPTVHCRGILTVDGDRFPAIAEDYVEGDSLNKLIDQGFFRHHGQGENVDVCAVARVALEIVGALQEVHSREIRHRDLSPKNIILEETSFDASRQLGDELRVVLIDFGQATYQNASVTLGNNARLAAVPYGPPEMYSDKVFAQDWVKRKNPSTDVWSLGALITAMVIGEDYWPEGLIEVKKKLDVGAPLTEGDLKTIAETKSTCINLLEAANLNTESAPRPLCRLSQFVESCTNGNPDMRIELHKVPGILTEIIEMCNKPAVPSKTTPSKTAASTNTAEPKASNINRNNPPKTGRAADAEICINEKSDNHHYQQKKPLQKDSHSKDKDVAEGTAKGMGKFDELRSGEQVTKGWLEKLRLRFRLLKYDIRHLGSILSRPFAALAAGAAPATHWLLGLLQLRVGKVFFLLTLLCFVYASAGWLFLANLNDGSVAKLPMVINSSGLNGIAACILALWFCWLTFVLSRSRLTASSWLVLAWDCYTVFCIWFLLK